MSLRSACDTTIMLVHLDVSIDFLRKNALYIDWGAFCRDNKLTSELITALGIYMPQNEVSARIDLGDTDLVASCADLLNWDMITLRAVNTKFLRGKHAFISTFYSLLDWDIITLDHTASREFVNKWAEHLNWSFISYKNFSLAMFRKHAARIDWLRLVTTYELSPYEMRVLDPYLPWNLVAKYQVLDERIIEDKCEELNWAHVSEYQPLSLKFIKKHKDTFSLASLLRNKHLTSLHADIRNIYEAVVQIDAVECSEPCPICRDTGGAFGKLVCGHVYHTECIQAWIKISSTCPLCRQHI